MLAIDEADGLNVCYSAVREFRVVRVIYNPVVKFFTHFAAKKDCFLTVALVLFQLKLSGDKAAR